MLRRLNYLVLLALPVVPLGPSTAFAEAAVDSEAKQMIELAASRVSAAEAAETTSFTTANNLYRSALEAVNKALSRFPDDTVVGEIAHDKRPIGNVTLGALRDTVIPAMQRRADAEADPLKAVVYVVDRKAHPSTRSSALNTVLHKLIETGKLDAAIDFVKSKLQPYDQVTGLLSIADKLNAEDKIRANAVQEDAAKQASELRDPGARAPALIRVARYYGTTGPREQSVALLQKAYQATVTISNISDRTGILAEIAAAHARLGEEEQADKLFSEATELLSLESTWTNYGWERLALAFADARRYEDAVATLVTAGLDTYQHASSLLRLVDLATEQEDSAVAATLLANVNDSVQALARHRQSRKTAEDLIILAGVATQYGNTKMAGDLLDQAEAIAVTVPKPDEQAWVLDQIAGQYLALGDTASATGLLERCLELAGTPDPGRQFHREESIIVHLAEAGQPQRSLRALRALEPHSDRPSPLIAIAKAFHASGSKPEALKLLEEVQQIIEKQGDPQISEKHRDLLRIQDTIILAEAYAAVSEPERAKRLLSKALQSQDVVKSWGNFLHALGPIAKNFHAMGDTAGTAETLSLALNLVRQVPDGSAGHSPWPILLSSYVAVDRTEQAVQLAEGISDEPERLEALTTIIAELSRAKKTDSARELASRITPEQWALLPTYMVTELATAYVLIGDTDTAERLFTSVAPEARAGADVWLAGRLAKLGHRTAAIRLLNRATTTAQSTPDSWSKTRTLMAAAAILDTLADSKRAKKLLADARSTLDSATKDVDFGGGMATELGPVLAQSYAKAGYYDRGIQTARSVRALNRRVYAFLGIAKELRHQGNPGRALVLLTEEIIPLTPKFSWDPAILSVAEMLADLGEESLALEVVEAATIDETRRPGSRARVARIYLKLNRYQSALRLIDTAFTAMDGSTNKPNWTTANDLALIAQTIAETSPDPPEQARAILHRMIRLTDTLADYRN